jgi:hypothetical protein
VTFQKSTDKIPERIVPTLDKLYDDFRSFGNLLNIKIEKLQNSVFQQGDRHEYDLKCLSSLRECVRSAADVVSTASTTLNAETSEKTPVRDGSDFGDIFIRDANEPMLRWFASNIVYEFEDMEPPLPDTSEISTGDALTGYQSDSDSDIENDLIRSLFKEGKKRKEHGDISGAVRHFQNCLTRLSSNVSYTPLKALKSASACGVSRSQLLENLIDAYSLLGSWSKARVAMVEKLSITERQVGKQDELYLWDTVKLADLMMKHKEYVGARLQGRQSLQGFKKLGASGHQGYKTCLEFLIQVCNEEGTLDEEEAYTALLSNHQRKSQQVKSVPDIVPSSTYTERPPGPSPQLTSRPSLASYPESFVDAAKLMHITSSHTNQTEGVETSPTGAHTPSSPPLDTTEQSFAVPTHCEPPDPQKDIVISNAGRRDPGSDEEIYILPIDYEDRSEVDVRAETAIASSTPSNRIADIPHVTISTDTIEADLPATPTCELQGDSLLPTDLMCELTGGSVRHSASDSEISSTQSFLEKLSNPQPFIALKGPRTPRRALSLSTIQPKTTAWEVTPRDDHQHVGSCVDITSTSSGTWACQDCKSDTVQFLSQSVCCSCSQERDDRSPSSLNDFRRPLFDRYQTLLTSLNPDARSTRHSSMLRRKILLLGDTLCGKTFLANEWSQKNIHQVDTHAMQTFIQSTWMEGRQIELVIWDNAGLDRYEGFRRLSYNLVHVVLICFDISNPDSFENIDYVVNLLLPMISYCSVKLTVTVERGGG